MAVSYGDRSEEEAYKQPMAMIRACLSIVREVNAHLDLVKRSAYFRFDMPRSDSVAGRVRKGGMKFKPSVGRVLVEIDMGVLDDWERRLVAIGVEVKPQNAKGYRGFHLTPTLLERHPTVLSELLIDAYHRAMGGA